MGTWGPGPFDSDHVGDELDGFARKRTVASGAKVIESLIDSPQWSAVVAGAELINIVRGHGKHDDDTSALEPFHDWVTRTTPTISASLLKKARERLAYVVSEPSIQKEWNSPALGKKWKKITEDILRRLRMNR